MVRQYIGARYVPRFMGNYDATQIYEALDVVDNGLGTSYIAKIPTPANTPLTNTTYWAVYGSTSGAIINLQNQINKLNAETVIMFDNITDMIAEDLSENDYCETLGYYAPGDFGGAIYKIESTAPASPQPYETLNNGLYAIPQNLIYLEQIGAKHDGVSDITSYVAVFDALGRDINLITEKTYYIASALSMSVGINVHGNNAILVSGDGTFFDLSGGYSGNLIEDLELSGGDTAYFAITLARPECVLKNIVYHGNSSFIDLQGIDTSHSAYSTTIDHCEYTIHPSQVVNAERIGVKIDIYGGQVRILNSNFATCNTAIKAIRGVNIIINNCNISGCLHTYFSNVSSKSIGIEITNAIATIVRDNYLEECDQAIYLSGTGFDCLICGNFMNMLDAASYVVESGAFKSLTSMSNRYKSTKASSIGIKIDSNNTISAMTLNDNFDGVSTGFSGNVQQFGNNRLSTANALADIKRVVMNQLSSASETVNVGGHYFNPSIPNDGSQAITLDIPQGSIFSYYAYSNNIAVTISAGGRTFTKTLKTTGGPGVIQIINLNGDYIEL